MSFEIILLLAFVQSATEFLPVSSSGHLVLMDTLGISNQNLLMDIALHVGTLIAVCAFFSKDIIALLTGFWHKGSEQKLGISLIIATMPTLIAGFFLENIIETVFRSPAIIAYTSIFYGLLLWVADKFSSKSKNLVQITYLHALYIGLAQVLALIPGTSRSGITMTCSRFLGYQRTDCAKFSMLLSIPVIGLGAGYMFIKAFLKNELSSGMGLQIGIGVTASAVFGLFAVWFLMRWLKTASFAVFTGYRIILGIILLFLFV